MARQRFIHPELWDDPDLGRVSPLAFILYIASFSNADDAGRLFGDPAYLKTQAFRYRPEVTLDDVIAARDELAETCSHYCVYVQKGVQYVALTNWHEYQKPRYPKPSKHPPPPGRPKARKRGKTRRHAKSLAATATATDEATNAEADAETNATKSPQALQHRVGLGREVLKPPSFQRNLDHPAGRKETTNNGDLETLAEHATRNPIF